MCNSDTICNGTSTLITDIVLFVRGLHTLIRNVSFPSPTDVGSHNPLRWGPASSLAHCPVSDSNTICNGSSTPLADIVLFELSLSGLGF